MDRSSSVIMVFKKSHINTANLTGGSFNIISVLTIKIVKLVTYNVIEIDVPWHVFKEKLQS